MHRFLLTAVPLLAGLVASGTAMSHTGIRAASGFSAGWAHPLMGLDHLLAMVAVGVWAVQLGGRFLLILPAIFVAAMAAGAAGGIYGIALPQVESMMALSVLALGMLVALAVKTRWHWPVSLIALFAMFHGHAHGTEMPEFSTPWLYFAGFMIATASLHALGVAAGAALKSHPGFLRTGGVAVGVAGSWLLLAALA